MVSVNTQRLRGTNSSAAIKVACIAASTGNLTLEAEQTVDGIALVDGDRVFCKDQTDGTENGIYKVSTGDWVREPDFNGSFDVVEGTLVPVSRGSTNADTFWKVTNTGSIVIGTTSLTFSAVTVLDSAILNDNSVKMIADFTPNASALYSIGESTNLWTSVHLSSAMNSNSVAASSAATVGATLAVTGTVTASSNATVAGTLGVTGAFASSGTATFSTDATVAGAFTGSGTITGSSDAAFTGSVTMSSDLVASLLTTALSGTDPGVVGQIWVSTSTGATAGKFLLVSTGP